MLMTVHAEAITSPANPLLREIRRAVGRGALTRDGFAIAETPHLLEEALLSGCEIGCVAATAAAIEAGLPGPLPPAVRVLELPEELFASIAATETPQGVIALVRPPAWGLPEVLGGSRQPLPGSEARTAGQVRPLQRTGTPPLVLILDGVQDPGNAGAMLRSAEAFGATGALFLKGTVSPYNPKAVRASAGSVFRLPLVAGIPAAEALAALSGMAVFAAAADGELPLPQAPLREACAIAIGSEGSGVSAGLRAACTGLRIPTRGVESLNAAIAAAVLLYEASRQRSA